MGTVRAVTATILFESNDGNEEGLARHVLNAVKGSCRNARNGSVAVAVYDDNGKFLGSDVTGTPSEEMQKEISLLSQNEAA